MSIDEQPNRKYKLSQRFGDEILEAGHTSVPNLLLRYQAQLKITAPELNFILQNWYHWWTEKDPYPALRTIAQRMGAKDTGTVRRHSGSLQDKGFLVVRDRVAPRLGQLTSEYDWEPLLNKLRELYRQEKATERAEAEKGWVTTPRAKMPGGPPANLPGGPPAKTPPEEYSVQEYPGEKDKLPSNDKSFFLERPHFSRISKKSVAKYQKPDQSGDLPDPDLTRTREAAKSFSSVGTLISQRQALQLARVDESSVTAEVAPRRKGRPPKATPWIEQLITDFSGELHDEEHVAQNISQAARLWKASRHSESSFAQLLYAARATTKQYNIKKRAQGPRGEMGLRNKMPYFFSVLKDLLGLKDPREASAFDQPGAPPG